MTEAYWLKFKEEHQRQFFNNPDNKFWQNVKKDLARRNEPKHHLELYSMCKSQNPYIRQIKNSPNITTGTVAEIICRDKACELQYCLSIQNLQHSNRRKIIDLKGCKEQYDTMWTCLNSEVSRIEKKEEELKVLVKGGKIQEAVAVPIKREQKKQQRVQYI